jgi:hypothetical protein
VVVGDETSVVFVLDFFWTSAVADPTLLLLLSLSQLSTFSIKEMKVGGVLNDADNVD